MAEKRVPVLAPDPETGRLRFATVNESEAHIVEKAGGRLLSAKEAMAEQQQATYDAKSTTEKVVGGVAGTLAGPIVGNALAGTGTIAVAPQVQAFQQGEAAALTGGLDQVAVMKGLEAVAGKEAAKAYGRNQIEISQANEGWKTAGELTGFAVTALSGSVGGAARALPGIGIQALGGVAESAAARAMGGVAARGFAGRALATGVELGARGAVEGAIYGAANELTEEVLGDRELAADKIFAASGHGALMGGIGGALLGGTGSLAKSAVVGTANAARGGLARAMGRASDVVADEGKALAKAGTEAVEAAPKAGRVGEFMRDPDAAARKLSNELAFDALNATKVQARDALGNLKAAEVGEYVNRVALKPLADGSGTLGGTIKAGMGGRADEILSVIQADKYGRVAEGLSSSIKGTGARLDWADINSAIQSRYQTMLKDPTQITGADAFRNRIANELSALGNAGKIIDPVVDAEGKLIGGTLDATDLFYTRAALEKQAYEVTKNSGAAGAAYKGFLRELDGKIVNAIDDAAEKAGQSGRADAIKHWKREWQLASAAEAAAEGGAERVSHNNVFGIREAIGGLAGIATGHPLLGAATLIGGKIAKERGAAAAATLLNRAADMGLLSRAVKTVNGQMEAASRGLLAPPKRGPLPEMPVGTARERATAYQRQIAEWQANPQAFVDRVAERTEALNVNAPELAGAITQRMTDAFAFMASKMPSPPPPDPFNPKKAPPLTDSEAAKLARYGWYVEKPARFFDEVAHGKLTFEGIEVAKALMPGAFAELQQRTAEGLATLASQNRQPPYNQREALGALLGFPAVPSQRPDHAQFLQQNMLRSMSQEKTGPAPRPSSSKPTQRSALDRLESGGPGR